jgi:superfamily II DNA/RNA helicase
VQSYTGSGKTLAYLLPALTLALARARRAATAVDDTRLPRAERQRASEAACRVQAVIVAPSKELAMQIVRVARALLLPAGLERAVQQCIGGANPERQKTALQELRPLAVVGTPGRLAEFVRSGDLRVHSSPLLILDEADQLLAPNFERDLDHVMGHCGRRLEWAKAEERGRGGGGGEQASAAAATAQKEEEQAEEEDLFNPPRQVMLVSATLSLSVLSRFARWGPPGRGFSLVTSAAVQAQAAQAAAAQQAAAKASKQQPSSSVPRIVSDAEVDRAMGLDASGSASSTTATAFPEWGWGHRGTGGGEAPAATFGAAGGAEAAAGLAPELPPTLDHVYVISPPRDKADAARRALATLGPEARALVFMNHGPRLKDAAFKLAARGVEALVLHGDLGKLARQRALERFARGEVRALVVSDVAARGLDLPFVDAVVNLELPSSAAHYAHRAGRAGRFGAAGLVVSVVEPRERFVVERLAARLAVGSGGAVLREAHAAGGELRDGPDPRREQEKKKLRARREEDGEAAAAGEEAVAAKDRSKKKKKEKAKEDKAAAPKKKASGAAAIAPLDDDAFSFGYSSGSSSPSAAFGGGKRKKGGAAAASSSASAAMEVVVDPDDDVPLSKAEEAESPEERRARLRAEVEAELAELRAEKARLGGGGGGKGAGARAAAPPAAAAKRGGKKAAAAAEDNDDSTEPPAFDPAALASELMAQIDGKRKPAVAVAKGGGGKARGGGGGGQRRTANSSSSSSSEPRAPRPPSSKPLSGWDW